MRDHVRYRFTAGGDRRHGQSKPLRTDGGEESTDGELSEEFEEPASDEPSVLEYGDTAEAVGEPDLVFGRHGDELVFIPETVLGWSGVEENVEQAGKVRLDEMSESMREMVVGKLREVDVDERAEDLAELSQLNSQEARVLLLFEGFQLSETAVADRLDSSVENVLDVLDEIYGRYDLDTVVEDIREQSILTEQEAKVLALAEGYGLDVDEIAAELDTSAEDVRTIRRTIREEYDIEVDLSDHQLS